MLFQCNVERHHKISGTRQQTCVLNDFSVENKTKHPFLLAAEILKGKNNSPIGAAKKSPQLLYKGGH